MKFGQRINISAVYVRQYQNKGLQHWHVWQRENKTVNGCIFLGTRQLKNGIVSWEDDCKAFTPKKHITAALICLDERRNPVYVPLNCIHKS